MDMDAKYKKRYITYNCHNSAASNRVNFRETTAIIAIFFIFCFDQYFIFQAHKSQVFARFAGESYRIYVPFALNLHLQRARPSPSLLFRRT